MLIHLVGICGTGMGSFAGLLKAAGHDVRGSDENVYPPMSDKLRAWGIPVMSGYRKENLDPRPDLVVIGNVIKRTNAEAQAVVEGGFEYTSFPKALGDLFLEGRHSIVIAGTHGKTTTTSLTAWLLTSAGKDPGMLVGGVPENFGEGFRKGGGEHFVVEGDEYDTAYFDKVPKFLHYKPKTLVMTSLEYDHADIYPSVEAIEVEFDKLVRLVPQSGRVIACASDPRVVERLHGSPAPYETYTAKDGVAADWRARNIALDAEGATFEVVQAVGQGASAASEDRGSSRSRKPPKAAPPREDFALGRFFVPLAGRHNVENALAAIAVAVSAKISVAEIDRGLRAFKGVARRQTVRAEIGGVRVIDDFAHHPTAVKETIAAIRARYPKGRLFAIFEPRTATSARKIFQDAYAEAFDGADEVIIAGVGRKELGESERLDIDRLARDIVARGRPAKSIAEIGAIVSDLAMRCAREDTLLFMSNGAFGGIYTKIEEALRARFGG